MKIGQEIRGEEKCPPLDECRKDYKFENSLLSSLILIFS